MIAAIELDGAPLTPTDQRAQKETSKVSKGKSKLKLGQRLMNGSQRVGSCPVCGKLGAIEIGMFESGMGISIDHAASHHELMRSEPLNVREAALLCGVRPVTIYTAVHRGVLRATYKVGWPIMFSPGDFAAYFNAPDRRRKEAEAIEQPTPTRAAQAVRG